MTEINKKLNLSLQDRFENATKQAATDNAPEKSTWDFSELWQHKDIKQEFIIPEILPAHAVAVIIGEDGIGKTQILTQLCLHICSGQKSFLTLPLNYKHGRCLIVATEDGRLKFIQAAAKQVESLLETVEPEKIRLKFTEGSNFDDLDKLLEEILTVLKKEPHDLVILDALSDLFGLIDGEINSNSHARIILNKLQKICETQQTTILLIHHVPKTKLFDKYKMGKMFIEKGDSQGASAITQKPRTILALTHNPKSYNEDGAEYENFLHAVKANLMGRYYINHALKLNFDTKTLLHDFRETIEIKTYEADKDTNPHIHDAKAAKTAEKRKYDENIPLHVHEENMKKVFGKLDTLSRVAMVGRMKQIYEVGFNKINEHGGIIQQLLNARIISKEGLEYRLHVIRDATDNVMPPIIFPDEIDDAPF